jgi:DNA-binding NarL/FixJ family response regulator
MTLERTGGATTRPLNGATDGAANSVGQTRVAIVDMDRRVRSALAEVLRVAGLEVVGTAGEARTAVRLLSRGAEILVVDPRLPELSDGNALVELVSRDWPTVRVVVMGWGDVGDSPVGLANAAFVTKSAKPDEFVAATLAACGC